MSLSKFWGFGKSRTTDVPFLECSAQISFYSPWDRSQIFDGRHWHVGWISKSHGFSFPLVGWPNCWPHHVAGQLICWWSTTIFFWRRNDDSSSILMENTWRCLGYPKTSNTIAPFSHWNPWFQNILGIPPVEWNPHYPIDIWYTHDQHMI